MKTLRDLKLGDSVFVVHQKRRYASEQKMEMKIITRVGRLYAYIDADQFFRDTGSSHHGPDSNARANGYGFDVYVSEDAYRQKQHEASEHERLQGRLVDRFFRLNKLTPKVVAAIHGLLDEWQAEETI